MNDTNTKLITINNNDTPEELIRLDTHKNHMLNVMPTLTDMADEFTRKYAGYTLWIEYRHSQHPEGCCFSLCVINERDDISEQSFVYLYCSHIEAKVDYIFQPTQDGFKALTARLDNLAMSN